MNVILLEHLGNLGELGDEITVKAGFARNYLLPQGKAVRATDANRKIFEERRAELEKASADALTAAQGRARELEGVDVTILVKAGEEGKLYGSVGTQDIADALAAKGLDVQRSEVRLPEGVIRVLGEYEIDVQVHSEVTVSVSVTVAEE